MKCLTVIHIFCSLFGKEVFDAWIGKITIGEVPSVAMNDILRKLDLDFFAPRWARATDRQQDFMRVIASMPNAEGEFSVQDIVLASRELLKREFNPSHATQILRPLQKKDWSIANAAQAIVSLFRYLAGSSQGNLGTLLACWVSGRELHQLHNSAVQALLDRIRGVVRFYQSWPVRVRPSDRPRRETPIIFAALCSNLT